MWRFRAGGALWLVYVAVIAAPSAHAQGRLTPSRLDFTLGRVDARGSNLRNESVWTMQAALMRRVAPALRVGGAWTWRSGGGRGDVCVFPPGDTTRCLDRVPGQAQASVLLGTGVAADGLQLEVVAGPALAFGEGRPLRGATMGGDIALHGNALGVVAGYRFTTLRRSGGERQEYRGPHLGLRVVF